MAESKIDRLLTQLQTSGLQSKDNPLFQVIKDLILYLRSLQKTVANTSNVTDNNAPKNADYLTSSDESTILPNSRELLAGTGISFDDTVANERTISSSSGGAQWDVLTDGFVNEPELIYAAGEVIMTHTP